jgi:chemotaxis protein CheC
MDDNIQLSELQCDVIIEWLNIGMGNAANSFSQMVNEEVKLSIPHLQLLSRHQLSNHLHTSPQTKVAAIKQHFHGSFWGDALLLFKPTESFQLVQIWLKDEIPPDKLIELGQDALIEVSNIIIGACLSSLANLLTQEFIPEIPMFMTGTTAQILELNQLQQDEVVMFLQVDLGLPSKNIKGCVAFILEIPSIEQFKYNIDKYLEKIC